MGINKPYVAVSELPDVIPVFPLPRVLILPRTQLPLNIFEPRYLAMFDDAMKSDRIIGMIQPSDADVGETAMHPPLHAVGAAGRITQIAESGDGRYLITLTGVCRFRVLEELPMTQLYRRCRVSYAEFAHDLVINAGEDDVDRDSIVTALRTFSKARGLKIDWDEIQRAPTEALVNALSMMSPFGPGEKQALLEAPDLKTRAETLVAITEFDIARDGNTPSVLQ